MEELNTTAAPAEEISPEGQARENDTKTMKKMNRSVKAYQMLMLRLLLLGIVVWVLFFQIVGLTRMPSGDMEPHVKAGDMVLFYRLDRDVKAQDVIVLEKTTPDDTVTSDRTDGKALFILRVVAVAGDTVEIRDGRLVVNGNTLLESNIYSKTQPYEDYTAYPLTLGEGQCFVLADHREGGADSRYFGPVDQSDILGTVITIMRRNKL